MNRRQLRSITTSVLKALARIEFQGVEYVPQEGGLIVATNHMSRMDIGLLLINPGRPDLTALVTDKYQDYPFFKWFIDTGEGIWIDRTRADFSAFRLATEALKKGRAVGIAPEGTRSTTGGLLEGKSGTALIALRAEVPIVPVAIWGTEDVFRKMFTLQRPHIWGRFGPSFVLPPLERENRETTLKCYTDEIMCRIAALLPEKHRGFYTNHPRLKELLAGAN
jgi:1-acyl-sn-glycerol-3-phosphate acyltransferase